MKEELRDRREAKGANEEKRRKEQVYVEIRGENKDEEDKRKIRMTDYRRKQ